MLALNSKNENFRITLKTLFMVLHWDPRYPYWLWAQYLIEMKISLSYSTMKGPQNAKQSKKMI